MVCRRVGIRPTLAGFRLARTVHLVPVPAERWANGGHDSTLRGARAGEGSGVGRAHGSRQRLTPHKDTAVTTIKVVCQFCHAKMREKDGQGMSGTSHGICPICRLMSEDEQKKVYQQTLEMEAARRQGDK